MADTMADTSTEGERVMDLTWGPSNSEDDESELTGTQNTFAGTQFTGTTGSPFFTREKLDSTWTFIEENFGGLLQCKGTKNSVSDEIEDFIENGCNTDAAEDDTADDDTKKSRRIAAWRGRKMSSTVSTPSGTATSSFSKEKEDEWFSPPRLRNLATTLNAKRQADVAEQRRVDQIPHKILEEPGYLSDMDTFLSDEFTHMEQGFFNGVYDHICNPLVSVAKGKETIVCSGLVGEPNSVSLSFDDTISKLTMEDGHKSISAGTLNTLERMKGVARNRAAITAIVNAQSSGVLPEMAKEEAEAKAEELSRYGIEQTISNIKTPPEPPKDRPSDNVIIVHHIPERAEEEEAEFYPDFQANFPFEEGDPYGAPGKAHAKPSKSMRKRLFRHFRKKIDKIKKKSSKAKQAWPEPMTPSSNPEGAEGEVSPPGTPRSSRESTTDPCSVTSSTEGYPVIELHDEDVSTVLLMDALVEHTYVQVEDQDQDTSEEPVAASPDSSTQKDAQEFEKSPAVIEEVEILQKRKEPVYTSYVRTQSGPIVEDVEVLRQESIIDPTGSDLSTLKINTKHRVGDILETLETVNEEGGAVTEWSPYDDDEEEVNDLEEGDNYEWFHHDAILPQEVQDVGNDDHQTACSSMTPSLLTMTSRLDKEREETDKLRIMLQQKDEDLERLRELLQMNDAKAVVERINSSAKASPLHESRPMLAAA